MANGESVGHVVRENFVYRMRENERHNFGVNYAFLQQVSYKQISITFFKKKSVAWRPRSIGGNLDHDTHRGINKAFYAVHRDDSQEQNMTTSAELCALVCAY